MTSLYQSLVSAGQQVGKFVSDSVEQVQGSIEQFQKSSEALKNSTLPGSTETQAKIGKMLDQGYGQHFVDAFQEHSRGKVIHPDDLNVLNRFGLGEVTPAATMTALQRADDPFKGAALPKVPDVRIAG